MLEEWVGTIKIDSILMFIEGIFKKSNHQMTDHSLTPLPRPSPHAEISYLFRPTRSVFHALVRAGSTCQDAPDLSGPIISHLNGGRLSESNTSKRSSLNKSGTV